MSKLEASYAALFDASRKASLKKDRVVDVKRQVKVSFDLNGVHICNYYMDFVVMYADGREEWVEVKGYETDIWKMKAKMFRAFYPKRIYKILR